MVSGGGASLVERENRGELTVASGVEKGKFRRIPMLPRHFPAVLFVAALLLSQAVIAPAAPHEDVSDKKDGPPRPKPKPGPREGGDDN